MSLALKQAAFTLEGFYDALVSDAALFASLANKRSVMVAPDGKAAGDVAYIVPVTVSAQSPLTGSVGDLATFSYASEGDGATVRAQVFDVREGLTSDNVTPRVNLGPILTGETLDVWVHVARRSGRVQISVESAVDGTTASAMTRGGAAGTTPRGWGIP